MGRNTETLAFTSFFPDIHIFRGRTLSSSKHCCKFWASFASIAGLFEGPGKSSSCSRECEDPPDSELKEFGECLAFEMTCLLGAVNLREAFNLHTSHLHGFRDAALTGWNTPGQAP